MKSRILRRISFLFISSILLFTGCNSNNTDEATPAETSTEPSQSENVDNEKLTVYTSFFPVHDLTEKIVGDKWDLRTIIRNGEEPHGFELKTKDMAEITDADLIIYNGAGMESFIDDLKATVNDDDKFLDLSQGLVLLETEGSDLVEENSNSHDNVNPHTWLSIRNAIEELDTIYQMAAAIDPENEEFFKANLEKSQAEFEELDKEFEETLSNVDDEDKYFVVSHAAFNYLANDYGLHQVAVTGLSPEDEPSAKQLKKIADFVEEKGLKTILFEGKATPKVAETLANQTGVKTDTIYTMESVSEEEAKEGYTGLMKKNLEVLMRVFNE
ncbi:zinc ABC transporter substrate-binding protein [Anaerococcus sp. AGMB09787]|uniref:metal ABC transporter solute-binding protein, Zn/Mn family n=1 Tax=Anaerococcus sp. AGMB09787 TaxID=2922869 RepID=UPI001FB01841|nr:zinc ABC transporter substrate-binding protein [Anaerococcus sp. AGMB09787]